MRKIYISFILLSLVLLLSACSKYEPEKKLNFDSCQADCNKQGFDLGSCLEKSSAGGELADNGSCVIAESQICNQAEACRCYCSYYPKNEYDFILEDLQKQTKLVFDLISPTEFEWVNTAKNKVIAQGKGFRVMNAKYAMFQQIGSYFSNQNYIEDPNNSNSGSISQTSGYVKGDILCQINITKVLDDNDLPVKEDNNIIKVKCGKIAQ